MNLLSAALFLVRASMRNWAATQVTRLRRPRYALGLVVVLLYVYSVGLRGWVGAPPISTPTSVATMELMLLGIATLGIGTAWVLGGDDAVLRFTQAEVQFLFPAPTTRRQLVLYKMWRTLLASTFSALFATVLFAPRITSHRAWFAVGAWLALSTLNFHLSAASLTRAMLVDLGLAGLRRRVVTLLVAAAILGAIGWSAIRSVPPPDPSAGTDVLVGWAITAVRTPPLGWVLLPLRAAIETALATDLRGFLGSAAIATGVLGVHAAWVLGTAHAFEDASVAAAEQRAIQVQVRKRGWSPLRKVRAPLPLAGTGRPEVALVWKSVLAAIRLASLRVVLVLGVLALSTALVLSATLEGQTWLAVGAIVALSVGGYLAVMGAQLLRVDLRLDLPQLDLLRSYPLSGREVVVGQIVGPAVILAILEWMCVLAALALASGWEGPPELGARLALAASLAIALPVVSLCGLVVQNGAVLVFPEWAVLDAQVGPEALGRRLILLVLNLFLMVFATLPATGVVAGVMVLAAPWVGLAALPIATAAGALVVVGEMWLVIGRLGRWFEAFDVSEVVGADP